MLTYRMKSPSNNLDFTNDYEDRSIKRVKPQREITPELDFESPDFPGSTRESSPLSRDVEDYLDAVDQRRERKARLDFLEGIYR